MQEPFQQNFRQRRKNCLICWETKKGTFINLACKHSFCKNYLNKILTDSIQSKNIFYLRCPMCRNEFNQEEINLICSTHEQLDQYHLIANPNNPIPNNLIQNNRSGLFMFFAFIYLSLFLISDFKLNQICNNEAKDLLNWQDTQVLNIFEDSQLVGEIDIKELFKENFVFQPICVSQTYRPLNYDILKSYLKPDPEQEFMKEESNINSCNFLNELEDQQIESIKKIEDFSSRHALWLRDFSSRYVVGLHDNYKYYIAKVSNFNLNVINKLKNEFCLKKEKID